MATKYNLTRRVKVTGSDVCVRDGAGHEITVEELAEIELLTDFQGAADLDDGLEYARAKDADGNDCHVYRWEEE